MVWYSWDYVPPTAMWVESLSINCIFVLHLPTYWSQLLGEVLKEKTERTVVLQTCILLSMQTTHSVRPWHPQSQPATGPIRKQSWNKKVFLQLLNSFQTVNWGMCCSTGLAFWLNVQILVFSAAHRWSQHPTVYSAKANMPEDPPRSCCSLSVASRENLSHSAQEQHFHTTSAAVVWVELQG